MGDTHLRFRCNGGDGNRLDVICFGAFDSDLGPMIAAHQGRRLHLAGQIEINFWGGRQTPQLRLDRRGDTA